MRARSDRIAGMRVDALTYEEATSVILSAAAGARSSYVCVANVHMVMEAHDDPEFSHLVERALLVTPDGQPLVWALRLLGHRTAERVYGPTLTLRVCEAAERAGLEIALYGGTPESLDRFVGFLGEHFPALRVACAIAPPFRPPTAEEDDADTFRLARSGARILLVGIGCPKQERWMAAHRERIPAVMLGVGAAFDFHSGRVRQAPAALQRMGLEWAFRLAMEPRRLWRRYLRHNPRFVVLIALQWLRRAVGLDPKPATPAAVSRPVRSARRHRTPAERRRGRAAGPPTSPRP